MQKKLFCGLVLALSAHAALALDLCTPATVNLAALTTIAPNEPMASVMAMMACPPSVYNGLAAAWSVPFIGDTVIVSLNPTTGGAGMVSYVNGVTGLAAAEIANRDTFTGNTSWVRGPGQP
jgi:hypothetical protein